MATPVGVREAAACTQCKGGKVGILVCHVCCGTGVPQLHLTPEERRERISETLRPKPALHPVDARIKAGLTLS